VLWRLHPILNNLIESGVDSTTSERRRFQTRASNILALAFAGLSVPYVVLELAIGARFMAAVTACSCSIYMAAIPLNRRGMSKLARTLPLVGATMTAGFACLVLTPASQVQLVLFMLGLWPFVLFDAREEWRYLVGLLLFPAAVYALLNAGLAPHIGGWTPSATALVWYSEFVPATTFVLNAGLLYMFYLRNQAHEDRLIAAVVSLEQANRAVLMAERTKAEFLAVMSHEVRTPLHAVLGCAELVRGESLGKDQEHWMRTLTNSAEYLLELITNILEYSRMDGSVRELHETQVDVRTLIEDAVGAFAEAISGKGVDLWLRVGDDVPSWLFLDPGRVRLVVACLVSNSAKFTVAGHVAITVSYRPSDEQRGSLSIEVADTGIGIQPSAHQRIFEMFRQVDTFEKRRQGGIGLGLTLSKAAAEIMNGQLTFDSTPGVGTRFMLTVPAKVAHAERLMSRASQAAEALSRLSVRVVTGNPEWTRALTASFTQWGHVVQLDSDEAPDVLVVDKRLVRETSELDALRRGNERVFVLSGGAMRWPGVVSLPRFLRRSEWFAALHRAQTAPWGLSQFPGGVNSERISERDFRPPEPRRERLSEPVRPKLVRSLLIADDQITNQKILRKLAEALAEQIIVVENGQLAVEMWELEQPSVILMDVQMPVMDGLEATRRIRASESGGQRTPIIAVTANALPEQRAEGLAAGMDVYLTKPIRLDELRLAITRYCVASARDEVA
jgi:signal transduction histidine kinase/CheY-like chemotaxis protein